MLLLAIFLKLDDTMKIYQTLEISVEDFCQNLDVGEAFEVIKKIDEYMADWSFTIDILGMFIGSVYNASEELTEERNNITIKFNDKVGRTREIKLTEFVDNVSLMIREDG